ncbi:polysaccharide deacetylase family sporulation protein PdaB [Pontibacillus litoralis]|uniref:Polysaccharide deacetylase n=1 Tax=Pontibacillus litoralis JSM 072002 TaxID=1385512 RepID=A0A0A5HL74_9BACI|nr:polysaccharide deacetylase family sporulation protein PdaB [Pontibacillus litoralis]KGX84377.1 polysaccharide deacetylase [Pontibacillus litoralis JSM 072002]
MQFFHVWEWTRFKKWGLIIVAALFCAVFLYVEKETVFSVFSTDKGPRALTSAENNEKELSLTFNISWGKEEVHPILDTLKEYETTATFFVSGEWAENHPKIVDRIVEDGHELGMLGYRYKSYIQQDINQVKKDLLYAKEVFRKLGYEDVPLLRTPNGHFNKEVLTLADQLQFQVIQWSVNPHDWENPGVDHIVDYVMKETKEGDIILLHASDSVKQTNQALETILPGLKNKGLQFVSVSELIAKTDAKSAPIE